MARPTFTFKPTFSINLTTEPRVERMQLGDGFVHNVPIGFRTNLRVWGLNFNVLRLDEVKPIIQFLEERAGYKEFQWTDLEPYKRPGIWIARRWDVVRPNGVLYNLSTTFEEQ